MKNTENGRNREREREICYATLGSANLLIMLLMFLSENCYGCFVYNVLQNNEKDKMESMRPAASHPFPYHIFSTSLSQLFWRKDREHSNSVGCIAHCRWRVSECGKRKLFICHSHFFCSAVFWSCRDAWSPKLRGPGKGHGLPERPSASSQPHLPPLSFCLSLCEQALIWQRKWIRNSFILLPHIYSFHRLWPLPTCVLISSWRAALHRTSITLKPATRTHNNFSGPWTETDTTRTAHITLRHAHRAWNTSKRNAWYNLWWL